jgi:hypothetical protein
MINKPRGLNIDKIQKNIKKKHDTFIATTGDAVIKVSADIELTLARLSTKVSTILDCLIYAGVIDKYVNCEESLYKGFHLIKNGFSKSMYIWIDGRDILFKDSNLSVRYGLNDPILKTYLKINVDEFDWENFANELVDYIHKVIYMANEATTISIFGRSDTD